ncbi:MAG: hypothetical protein ACI81R_002355 [Bradymonadia bacterium]
MLAQPSHAANLSSRRDPLSNELPDIPLLLARRLRLVVFVIVGLWLTCCAWQPHMTDNPASRFAGMEALVEHGTWAIDDTRLVQNTVDKVFWDGHYYSSKPPLLYTLAAPLYAVVRAVTGLSFHTDMYATAMWMRVFVGVLPWLCGLVLWSVLVDLICRREDTRLWGFCAMALGGLPTAYGSHLDNHSLAVVALLAFALFGSALVRPDRDWTPKAAATAGLFGGLAVTFDLGAGPLVGAVGLWVAARAWRRGERLPLALFIVCGFLAPIAQVAIQMQISGTLKPFYLLPEAYDYPGSYWSRPASFDALRESKPIYGFHALFGHHGIFSHTPWLLLGCLGLASELRGKGTQRALAAVVSAAVAFIVGYYVLRTNNYGGRCVGFRWFLVLVPAFGLYALRWVDQHGGLTRRPVALFALLGWSSLTALGGAINPWEEGVIYVLFRAVGLGSLAG